MTQQEDDAKALQEWLAAAVGEGVEEITAIARDSGYTVRVTRRDGVPRVGIRDYRSDRINLEVADGKVTRASVG